MNSKIETYIGFAIKKGSAVFGCDNIKYHRKKAYLILATHTLSPKSFKVLQNAATRLNCPLLKIDDYTTLSTKHCKALAITDKSLAQAILNVSALEEN